jgi:antitoxin ParD1/3/4
MHRKTITVTEQQDNWIKQQIESGQYGNDSEYIRHLLREDQRRQQAEQKLIKIMKQALDSGVRDKTLQQIWTEAVTERR